LAEEQDPPYCEVTSNFHHANTATVLENNRADIPGGIVSYNSKKGYTAERAIEVLWNERGRPVMRPRAGATQDIGDLVGMPLVQSVKNHKALALASWVDDVAVQTVHAGMDLGVVWHKRPGKGHPFDWYMTTSGFYGVKLVEAWCEHVAAS
jgi:hypothetical protein